MTVDFATNDGSATVAGQRLHGRRGHADLPAGHHDPDHRRAGAWATAVVEPDESFTVDLSNPSGATIADGQGLGTILNDDAATLSIDDVSLAEGGAGTSTFPVHGHPVDDERQ